MTRSRLVKPEHVKQVCAALGLDEKEVLGMTTEDMVAALAVAVAKLHGHDMDARPSAKKEDDE